jgi:hypothetical protein
MVDRIIAIIEGHGEQDAVPVLLRRLVQLLGRSHMEVLRPLRWPKSQLADTAALRKAVNFAGRKVGHGGAILVLFDADNDCPAELAPVLLAAARSERSDLPIALVMAKMEYEAWFLAAARSLRQHRRVRDNASPPPDPEAIRDAKSYFERNILKPGEAYSPTIDQPAFTQLFDVDQARSSPSFDKFCRDMQQLLR